MPTAPLDISVVVPARDERRSLPQLIEAIEQQTLRPRQVVVADGMSQDGTREWLEQARESRPWLVVVDNPDRQISAALNRAVAVADNDVVARMDAHATYAPDYLERVAEVFQARPEVVAVGGAMSSVGSGRWGGAIASVLRRPVGMGGARHRVGGRGGPVDHAFSPSYRRAAVLAAGGFDERFLANEDFELDYRLRAAGGTIWLEPLARCTWQVRESPSALARQMLRYGFFRARSVWVHPDSLRPRQLAPPALVAGLIAAAAKDRRLGLTATLAYLVAAGGTGAAAARSDGASPGRGAVALPVIQLSWGIGFLGGIVRHRRARSESVGSLR